ncbi:MAG: extracellular solute-binding protein [Paracoccaceae bacterium]|mgnify:CR=1 FL=1
MKFCTGLAALSVVAALALPARADDPGLVVLDWAGLDIEGAYAQYKEKNGDKPTYAFFGSDDEAFQKLASGFTADVVEPCSQMVQKYRDAGLIVPWDPKRIPDLKDVDPRFLKSRVFQDDKGLWFIPTNWGVTAVAYNTKEVPAADVSTLQVFADPKYAGRISLPNSSDDVWALAYLATGVTSWDHISDDQFKAAADWLRKVHPNVRAYWNDSAELQQLMASGEVLVAWSWNDTVAGLKAQGFPAALERSPKEGSSDWLCGYVKAKNGQGQEQKAYDFINSWLRPEVAPALVAALGYGHTNKAGMAMVDPKALDDAGLGPVHAPIFSQTPKDPALHEHQLAEFEKIKAGF